MVGRVISDIVGVGYVVGKILKTSLGNGVSNLSRSLPIPSFVSNTVPSEAKLNPTSEKTFVPTSEVKEIVIPEIVIQTPNNTEKKPDLFQSVEKVEPLDNKQNIIQVESSNEDVLLSVEKQPEPIKEEILLPTFEEEVVPKRKLVEAKLPTTRVGRFFQYTSLAAALGFGTASEALKRSVGLSESKVGESALWNESNVNQIVTRLSRMRGAAQKLGQILSIQDANVLPPQIEKILFDIQHSGTYMPQQQLRKVLEAELGENWNEILLEFDTTPFAAASIGQVHWAKVLPDNSEPENVAVKVQYPGVAQAIDSDLDSLKLLLIASRLLPRGLYLEKTIDVARRELKWETDYVREANYALKFAQVLSKNPEYHVPKIYSDLSSKMVMTMERLPGVPLSKTLEYPQKIRDWIATKLMDLSLREVFEFKFMQTDPNWTNFLYDAKNKRLGVLDFGATREFSDDFLQDYLEILQSGVSEDREKCIEFSHRLGYLTGDEHTSMVNAHVDSIMILAEPFRNPREYNFADQTITARIRSLIPTMLQMRLTPPPEPTYSLHRKLSGAFLLCARLRARVNCHEIFANVAANYKKSETNEFHKL